MSKTQYDSIASEYQTSKELPFRIYAEAPLLLELMGDVQDKDVLDLACGEGIYARKLKQLGARHVLGVDLSEEMIALANKQERDTPNGLEFRVGDASTLGTVGSFDLVVGSYLLNYARTAEHLRAFCRTVVANLKPGGRFVALNDNPYNDPRNYPSYRKYGFIKSSPIPRREGDTVTYTMFAADGSSFTFNNYFLTPKTYEQVLAETFNGFRWHRPVINQAGLQIHGEGFWREFNADVPIIGIEAW